MADLSWIDEIDPDEEVMRLEPRSVFDSAIVGLARQFNTSFIVYSQRRTLAALMASEGMTEQEAIEWYEFNMAGAWVGKGTPAFLEIEATP